MEEQHYSLQTGSRQGITVTLHSASHRVMCISSSKQESIETFNCQEAVLETTPESYLQIGFTSLSRVRSVQISARDGDGRYRVDPLLFVLIFALTRNRKSMWDPNCSRSRPRSTCHQPDR
jgi:hypothetical protein